MRLALLALCSCLGLVAVTAGGASNSQPTGDANAPIATVLSDETPTDADTVVDIPDAVLRGALERRLGKNAGEEITRGDMARVYGLYASGGRWDSPSTGVEQLTGIEYAINLRSLRLPNGSISDLSPLAGLESLEHLDLGWNDVTDLSPLTSLTSLTHLDVGRNAGVEDVSPLVGLTSLEYLDVSGRFPSGSYVVYDVVRTGIRDLSPLRDLALLTHLDLGWNAVSDASPLAGLTSLTYLSLELNAVSDVSPLAGLRSLTHLDIYGNLESDNDTLDVSPLAGLTSLRYLSIGHSGISDLSPLAGLTSLETLYLWGNPLVDLSPLQALLSLKQLFLFDCATPIADVSPLARMAQLEILDVRGHDISDLSPLRGLTSLEQLYLGSNRVKSLSPLGSLTSLTHLSLEYNAVSDLSALANLTSLEYLDIASNYVLDLSPLRGLTSLQALYLQNNAISGTSRLSQNTGLGEGDVLDLRGNPLDRESVETIVPLLRERGVDVRFGQPPLPEGWEAIDVGDTGLRAALGRRLSKAYGFWIAREEVARLEGLAANDSAIEDVAVLEAAKGLLRLDLSGNAIADVAPLEDIDLLHLFLDGNDIADVGALAGQSRLLTLTLSDNAVEDVSPLAGLVRLRYLALDDNAVRDLSPLPGGLRHLHLDNNEVSDISALSDMVGLYELSLSGNSIRSVAPLAGGALRYLRLSDNQVEDLSPLNIASLVELHAKNNALREISPLLNGEALLMVDVRRNPLEDDALAVLETLRKRRVTVLAGESVPYFPAAGDGRQGFVRLVNRSDEDGHVFIEAVDDAGFRAEPVRLDMGARRAVHFNSVDLEYGSATKGIAGIGAPTAGDWRLAVISALDVEVLSYIRTEDGFVTAMHDVLPDAQAPFFNPGSNERQRSILRVVNTEAEPAKWTTGGYDDGGSWHRMIGSLLVRPQHALTLTAQALENTHGLGDGRGKWRLRVRGFPWFAMSLLESPTGHLTNLSTAPAHTESLADGGTLHRLPLLPAAGGSREGFVRVINRSYTSGEVAIEAVDDAGARSGPVRLTLRPRQTVHFNSADLEDGNPAKGLDGGLGVGTGDWRLEVASELELMVLAYARTPDGFLTSLHDLAPVAEDGSHRVVFFNPGSNARQVSKLRLINDGERAASVRITGIDDQGGGSETAVLTVPAGSASTFTSAELEAGGDRMSGRLGDGDGKWRLRVRSEEPIAVMSLLETPSGHLTNVSTGTAD